VAVVVDFRGKNRVFFGSSEYAAVYLNGQLIWPLAIEQPDGLELRGLNASPGEVGAGVIAQDHSLAFGGIDASPGEVGAMPIQLADDPEAQLTLAGLDASAGEIGASVLAQHQVLAANGLDASAGEVGELLFHTDAPASAGSIDRISWSASLDQTSAVYVDLGYVEEGYVE
jgi:hypothetical protein